MLRAITSYVLESSLWNVRIKAGRLDVLLPCLALRRFMSCRVVCTIVLQVILLCLALCVGEGCAFIAHPRKSYSRG
jgi:hypothetical protein